MAIERKTGARGLRAIMESVLREAMFDTPGSDITGVRISKDAAEGKATATYIRRPENKGNSEQCPDGVREVGP